MSLVLWIILWFICLALLDLGIKTLIWMLNDIKDSDGEA